MTPNPLDGQVDLTSGMSIEAARQVEELQQRVHVLEVQNASLTARGKLMDTGAGACVLVGERASVCGGACMRV